MDFESCRSFWNSISALFPDKVAAILMPNHFHIILPTACRFFPKMISGPLGALSRRQNKQKLWQPMPDPSGIPDAFHLRRHVRYIALNPCRSSLCKDPLEWYWSTYREIMGATQTNKSELNTDSWKHLAQVLELPKKDFQVRFHAYVSGDPSVEIGGTKPPAPALPPRYAEYAIGEILNAAAAALRVRRSDIRKKTPLRHFFIHFAHRHGWTSSQSLAEICDISRQAVYKTLNTPPPEGLAAADSVWAIPACGVLSFSAKLI